MRGQDVDTASPVLGNDSLYKFPAIILDSMGKNLGVEEKSDAALEEEAEMDAKGSIVFDPGGHG